MIDKLNEIWQTLGALIARHPSVAILLLFLLLLGGNIQRWLDGREIRGLKAENKRLRTDKDAKESRLKLAQDEQSDPPLQQLAPKTNIPRLSLLRSPTTTECLGEVLVAACCATALAPSLELMYALLFVQIWETSMPDEQTPTARARFLHVFRLLSRPSDGGLAPEEKRNA